MRSAIALQFLVLALQCPDSASAQLRLWEVMADPLGSEHLDEFVELLNTSQTDTLDLANWRLGDADELDLIIDAGEGTRLVPGGTALIVDGGYSGASTTYDSVRESARILTIEDQAFGRSGWSNSTPEQVLLVSEAGDTVDVFLYDPGAGRSGYSWERRRVDLGWQLSVQVGGTPGRPNSAEQTASATGRVDITLSPDPFAERLQIHCRLPAAPALLSVRIYDAEGDLVARLRDWEPTGSEEILQWDDRRQNGQPCPPGLYIVSVKASTDGRIVHGKAAVARQ